MFGIKIVKEVIKKDNLYFYEYYNNLHPLESATTYNISNDEIKSYLDQGYKEIIYKNNRILVKKIIEK